MANLFDTSEYPTIEPETIIVGDNLTWKREDLGADYPPASYALTYAARLEGNGSTNFAITAAESGDVYIVDVESSTTANYAIGIFHWSAFITNASSERKQIDSGKFEVVGNLAASSADPRSHAAKMVDFLETTLESLAQKLTTAYSVSDRSNTLRSIEDTRGELNYYRTVYNREVQKDRALSGRKTGQNILVRF